MAATARQMDSATPPLALILDLGGVFFTFADVPEAPIPPREFKSLVDSSEWHALESGKVTTEEAYAALADRLGLEDGALEESLRIVSTTLAVNESLVATIEDLKAANGELRVFGASNIPRDRYEVLRAELAGWEIFDDVYISADLGVRKPEAAFYDRVLKATGLAAECAVFVDNRPENVIAAQCCGMRGILFDTADGVSSKLRACFSDPVKRGRAWLSVNAKNMWCMTNTGVEVREQFQQLFMLHLLQDQTIVQIGQPESYTGRWNLFAYGPPVLTTDTYPDDLDTTTLALLALDVPERTRHKSLNDMLQFMNPDGLLYCYFDTSRPRIDPFVSANVLRAFYANGRGKQLAGARLYVEDMLRTRAYEHGTRYYHLPDYLLFYVAYLCSRHPDAKELLPLGVLVRQRLQERMGCTHDAPSAALRLIASNDMGIVNTKDREILLKAQHADGRWTGYIYRYGSSGILFGSDGLSTALAVAALQGSSNRCPR